MSINETIKKLAIKPRLVSSVKEKTWSFSLSLSFRFGLPIECRRVWHVYDNGEIFDGLLEIRLYTNEKT
jgi:hypothetical protein